MIVVDTILVSAIVAGAGGFLVWRAAFDRRPPPCASACGKCDANKPAGNGSAGEAELVVIGRRRRQP